MPAWSTEQVLGQPELSRESLSWKTIYIWSRIVSEKNLQECFHLLETTSELVKPDTSFLRQTIISYEEEEERQVEPEVAVKLVLCC